MTKEIILIHGWDYRFYNNNINKNASKDIAWSKRKILIELLGKRYRLNYFNLPGFCNVPEPSRERFDVEDFGDYLANWIKRKRHKPYAILGYSFGSVVALDYKARHNNHIPTVLISPAIRRKETFKSEIAHLAKGLIPEFISGALKNSYQYLFSKYYRNGTPFLRKSYDLIVRKDETCKLRSVDPKSLLLIYGLEDNATLWQDVENVVVKIGINYGLIKNGKHNIGETNPLEIVKLIDKFLESK
ncbi:MAG: alpha/beta hydrolase [Patescibacteria group bacterium]|nr:alpha/beta hydrolase [Patescibacteria group bacterium]